MYAHTPELVKEVQTIEFSYTWLGKVMPTSFEAAKKNILNLPLHYFLHLTQTEQESGR